MGVVAGLGLLVLLVGRILRSSGGNDTPSAPRPILEARPHPDRDAESEAEVFAGYAGSVRCRECHETAFEEWSGSNHRFAERPVQVDLDRKAFDPPRSFRHATQTTEVRWHEGAFEIRTPGLKGDLGPYRAERVIGHSPLRQFLVASPGGRWQTLEACYDPETNEWFNVYGSEDRQPGEWGHWTGRGMNWNQMCAGCHNTRLRKNYRESGDRYETTMAEVSVGCEACHGPCKAHVDWRKARPNTREPDPTLPPLPWSQTLDVCGACHSRRAELTGDPRPGDSFFDHFSLMVVDETDLYYPDGQIHDEDYEFAAFLGSRMHRGNVRCTDCHQPHSGKTLLPGNWLCLRCHNGSRTDAPLVDPIRHSGHKVFGYDTNGLAIAVDLLRYDSRRVTESGGECIHCHMPQTVYMQRHWRHDHGFTIPDPWLTRHWGVPNACSRCHADKDLDWALAAVDKVYGSRMERPTRRRAALLAAARRGEETTRTRLTEWLSREEIPYWQAATVSLLSRWADQPSVREALVLQLRNPHPLVREKAVRALHPWVEHGADALAQRLQPLLRDTHRCVRVAAGWALRDTLDPATPVGREIQHYLNINADQPPGQLQQAAWDVARGQPQAALGPLERAVRWDPNSAPLRHELAVVLSILGRIREAVEALQVACRLEPREAEYRFKLALALSEAGDLPGAHASLETTVQLDPRHGRAWYNLGLAQQAAGQSDASIESLIRAESLRPEDPMIPYARATVLAATGHRTEAREAARRALEIAPGFHEARELLNRLP